MPRSAATAASAALALAVLGMPGVALAGGPDSAGTRPSAGAEARQAPASSAPSEAAGRAAAVRPTPSATAARPAKPTPAARPATTAAPAAGKAARTVSAPTAQADPRGNNGTFKVDGPVLDTSRGNEPHVSCAFRLSFFGYDAGQLGRISLTAIAPTPGPTTRVDGLPLISSSSAKGGRYDGSYPTAGTLTAAGLGLDPAVAHHVKAQVEAVNADGSEVPGGAKSKVFWLEPCAVAAPAAVEVPVAAQVDAPVVGPRAVVAAAPAAAPVADPAGSAVLSGTVSAQSLAPSTVVAAPALFLPQGVGAATARPATLPFTGSPQTLILLMGGVIALAGGSALLVAVRRTP